ncbi:MAG: 50S ribosomal protein L9 [Proteobacteria bacterium]|nr:50S ribosomal protein L9 [Pseudomonadota bacterium]
MKVIMLESTHNVGMVGEIVNVKPGFARNYLLPLNKAVVADERNMKKLSHQNKVLEHKVKKAKEQAETLRGQIHEKEVIITKKSAQGKKLFGSVGALDIQQTVKTQLGFDLNRKSIILDDAIKTAGTYTIALKLDGGLESTITLIVRAEEEKQEKQAGEEGAAPKKAKRASKKAEKEEGKEEAKTE